MPKYKGIVWFPKTDVLGWVCPSRFADLTGFGQGWGPGLIWLFWVLFLSCLSPAQEVARVPGRVLTHYALVSAHDSEANDPTDWRLMGSNDRGTNWVVLQVRTNRTFGARGLRQMFRLTNHVAYSSYRLEILRVRDAGTNHPACLQLAEWELFGPPVGVSSEADLQCEISASQPHPLFGLPENAFDGDPVTGWIDYGLDHPGGCWI